MIVLKKYILIVLFLTFPVMLSFSASESDEHGHDTKEEKFQPGPVIIDHLIDAHDWHICDIGGKPISVPLPIILYSKHSGFHIFLSSKFEHGHASYKNFTLKKEKGEKSYIIEAGVEGAPIDLSITKIAASVMFSLALMVFIFFRIAKSYSKLKGKAPKGLQNALEPLILFIRDDIAKAAIGEKKYRQFMPFLLTVFFFILLNNLLGLVPLFPGGANVTGNITITLVLALFTFFITTINGNKNYWMHIINAPGVPWWLKAPIPLIPIIETVGLFIKPFVLMIRLFANITAGHTIMLGFFSLIFIFGGMSVAAGYGVSIVSVGFTVFMTMLELLVAFIQAYVFTMLSAIYFGMATEEHH